ncbi:HECT-like ubiquitin-conjugating enzyme-binding-domain-containing protein [Phellopilus nigrolimitatus]|nr:HECT-like ubiquitin-conjugating enzyme-binding-domain-containing protein [Phellopilus nigrolimitatus]
MATLTRARSTPAQAQAPVALASHVPAPFPFQDYRREQEDEDVLDALAREELDVDPFVDPCEVTVEAAEDSAGECDGGDDVQSRLEPQEGEGSISNELLPSLVYVQQSCLMTLNNLLSGIIESSSTWQPILPPRRHSMPPRPENTASNEPSSALHTLLANLRNSDQSQMSESSSSSADDAVLLGELRRRVDAISAALSPPTRASHARSPRSSHTSAACPPSTPGSPARAPRAPSRSTHPRTAPTPTSTTSSPARCSTCRSFASTRRPAAARAARRRSAGRTEAEAALLWSKIDTELEAVSLLCRQRSEPVPRPYSPGQQPPEYEYEYEYATTTMRRCARRSTSTRTRRARRRRRAAHTHHAHAPAADTNEKMRMDLEAVTMAIDRLYLVAPQLHNQRVELRKSKLEELERARLAGPPRAQRAARAANGKGKGTGHMVGKASSRRMDDQSVVLDGDMQSRFEKARQKDNAKRDEFVEQLMSHSHSRRIASQDAIFQPIKTRNPDALLSLPEFIREQVPDELQQELDPEALLTLSEIVKEPPPKPLKAQPSLDTLRMGKKHFRSLSKRSRSLSAPPLSWLIPSLNRSPPSLRGSIPEDGPADAAKRLTVRYVAEHHENLNHVLVFLGVDEGMNPGVDLEADILPSVGDPLIGDKLILKCGSSLSAPLSLPVSVTAGKADVRVQGGHYEIKLPITVPSPSSSNAPSPYADTSGCSSGEHANQLLDATQVADMDPTSFICASCSSALVQQQSAGGAAKLTYQDLPSEHWAELLEAWMCHQDQKLTDRVAQHSRGFWPKPGQVFVGGSYFLFDESAVMTSNLRVIEPRKGDDWKRVQCICGSVVGRCQTHSLNEAAGSSVYRIPKYAVRPVSLTAEPSRIPFTAFILEDMLEIVQAHATYRFVVLDEEDERPRLLIWLFKPHIRLAYATTAQFALPQTGSVQASKVLFKILQVGPDASAPASPASPPASSTLESILQKYTGFPQAERLLYPRDVCERLTTQLRESNTAYPMGVRVMTGLLTGWLRKA